MINVENVLNAGEAFVNIKNLLKVRNITTVMIVVNQLVVCTSYLDIKDSYW